MGGGRSYSTADAGEDAHAEWIHDIDHAIQTDAAMREDERLYRLRIARTPEREQRIYHYKLEWTKQSRTVTGSEPS